jgi:hypothetical protein
MTDHFFLAPLMGMDKFHSVLHKPAVDLYFPKNPKLPIEEQDAIHNRAHLDPRGVFKTSLGRIDKVQFLLAFPQTITILNESATQPLAKAISKGIAGYFYCPKFAKPTLLQQIFPELVVDKEPFKNSETFDFPDRPVGDLDSTVAFTSPLSTQSGWHPYVINADDMVETKNSGIHANPDVRRGVIDTYDTNRNTLRKGGYIYLIGTRYHPFDLYGVELERMNPDKWKTLIRGSITVKSGARLVPGEFPAEDDVIVNFAELPGQDYESLKDLFIANYESYMCQQQNDPQGGNVATFDEKLYLSCQIDPDLIPIVGGETYVCWRMPYGGKKNMLQAEGVAARVVNGKVIVIDAWQGNYIPSSLAERMVQSYKTHQADGLLILRTPGSEFMTPHIRNESARRNVGVRIQWTDWEENDDRRNAEIKRLEPMLRAGRILFARDMTKWQECRKQFIHFGLVEENGIIECVSKFADMIPMSQMRANLEEEEISYMQRRRDDALLNSFLQLQGMHQVEEEAKQRAQAHLQAMQKVDTWTMPPLPGGLDG